MKKIKMMTIAGLLISVLTSCGASSLVGRWDCTDSSDELEFFSDGTYTSNDANYYGDYSVDGDRLKLQGVLMPDIVSTFKVSGDTLTIYNDDGEITAEYKKVN